MFFEDPKEFTQSAQETVENGSSKESTQSSVSSEITHLKEQLAYLRSDFENFRRRTDKERIQWIDSGKESVIKQLLPVVDDVDRALADLHSAQLPQELVSRLTGLELIQKTLAKTLQSLNVTEITETVVFDPELHEAVMYAAAEGKNSGDIVAVFQKGYRYKDTVIRPAQVSVAQ